MMRRKAMTLLIALCACMHAGPPDIAAVGVASVKIDAGTVLRTMDRRLLLGTNLGAYESATRRNAGTVLSLLDQWKPAQVRMPGGTWADAFFWNGNGVASTRRIDLAEGYYRIREADDTRFTDGAWAIDYSGYGPSFVVWGHQSPSGPFHGLCDAKEMHEYIGRTLRAKAFVTVNAGTGSPAMAAEWVRWANRTQGYGVTYWEVGNELEGAWSPGHVMRNGQPMDGAAYAERFAAFASAMKAEDPAIKVGGAASAQALSGFSRDMLEHAGDYVDFVSFHHYPTTKSVVGDHAFFGTVGTLESIVQTYRDWIRQHQPKRAHAIELGITEWNAKLPEDRQTGSLASGLWSCMFYGEMFKTGVDFAHHWDLFSQTRTGGHGMFHCGEGRIVPKSQYWAAWLWSGHMDDTLVSTKVTGEDKLHANATLGDDHLSVMLVNWSRDRAVEARIDVTGFAPAGWAHRLLLSSRSYFWNPLAGRPEWSEPPGRDVVPFALDAPLSLPPFSATVLRIPVEGAVAPPPPDAATEYFPMVELLAPSTIPARTRVECWAVYRDLGIGMPLAKDSVLYLEPEAGILRVTPAGLSMKYTAARFFIEAQEPGFAVLQGTMDGERVGPVRIRVEPVQETRSVHWSFESPLEEDTYASDGRLTRDAGIAPNAHVLAVALPGEEKGGSVRVLSIHAFPPLFPKEDFTGLFSRVRLSPDFAMEDAYASLELILQSESDHWVVLGRVPLSKLRRDGFEDLEGRVEEPLRGVTDRMYNLLFVIHSSTPVTGTVYLDDIGIMTSRSYQGTGAPGG